MEPAPRRAAASARARQRRSPRPECTARESSAIFRVPALSELLLEFGDALLELVNALLERGELPEDHRGLPPFAVLDRGNAGDEAMADRDVRMDHAVVADARARADDGGRINNGPRANRCARADRDEGSDGNVGPDPRVGRDRGEAVDAARGRRRLREESKRT